MLLEVEGSTPIIVALLQNFSPLLFVLIAFFTGRHFERKHLASLALEEAELSDIVITNSKYPIGNVDLCSYSTLVEGQVVIASDALKGFLSNFKMIFGGELKSYETLQDRARREAVVRMLKMAREKGYNSVCNLRIDFSCIKSGKSSPAVEVLVSATAYRTLGNGQ